MTVKYSVAKNATKILDNAGLDFVTYPLAFYMYKIAEGRIKIEGLDTSSAGEQRTARLVASVTADEVLWEKLQKYVPIIEHFDTQYKQQTGVSIFNTSVILTIKAVPKSRTRRKSKNDLTVEEDLNY
ncbi:MAG: hypothetical protein KME30_17265 [Iphinoe sp. HA4291-MV1]|jgi:hypothetical protein|nr:hypothetical protein [Iphinoe sp. HA4291-MV1]